VRLLGILNTKPCIKYEVSSQWLKWKILRWVPAHLGPLSAHVGPLLTVVAPKVIIEPQSIYSFT